MVREQDLIQRLEIMVAEMELNRRRQPFQAKINSDYNDFVARVALEVVDAWWWKHQLRVKSAGQRNSMQIWVRRQMSGQDFNRYRTL
jgi:hypothetical protein